MVPDALGVQYLGLATSEGGVPRMPTVSLTAGEESFQFLGVG